MINKQLSKLSKLAPNYAVSLYAVSLCSPLKRIEKKKTSPVPACVVFIDAIPNCAGSAVGFELLRFLFVQASRYLNGIREVWCERDPDGMRVSAGCVESLKPSQV